MNDTNFLKEIGRSYIVSAFLPAVIFVLLGYFLFRGFLPEMLLRQVGDNKLFQDFQWVILILSSLWVAFYLFSASHITVRIFEGYLFPAKLRKKLVDRQKKIWDKQFEKFYRWRELNERIMDKIKRGELIDEDEREQDARNFLDAQAELALMGIKRPLNPDHLMPTRLGNVLRASESYAYERYAIEEITIWPRLISVLPVEIARNIEEKNNHFMFLMNSAFLAYSNAVIGLFFGVVGLPIVLLSESWRIHTPSLIGFFYIGYDFIHPIGYILIGLALWGFGYVLYRIATNAAEDFGLQVRTSFDLYRVNLIRQLNWRPPKTLKEEQILWRDLTRFMIAGERMGEIKFPDFEYELESKRETNHSAPGSGKN